MELLIYILAAVVGALFGLAFKACSDREIEMIRKELGPPDKNGSYPIRAVLDARKRLFGGL